MCAMVFSGRNIDAMRESMPQTVPSAGFSPPCDYSAFEADCFDLSLLPCTSDCQVPLSPINIQHFLAMYSDPTTPPPMFHNNQDKDFDNFDHFKTMDEDNSHDRPFPNFEQFGVIKSDDKCHPLDVSTSSEMTSFEHFSQLQANSATMTNVYENFENLKSPLGQEMDVSNNSRTTINVIDDFGSLKSPAQADSCESSRNTYQYHSSPAMLAAVKEEPSYMLSPCMANYNSPYAPSASPSPSPSSSYASNLSPYPLSPSSQTGIKQEQTLDLQEILDESRFLQESMNITKRNESTKTDDLSQKVANFCNILMSNAEEKEVGDKKPNSDKSEEKKRKTLVLGNAFSSTPLETNVKSDDLMSKSIALGNLLLGCGSSGAVPKQEVASTSCKTTPKLGDHTLLREVLKDTSFQRKYNLRPFNFAGMGGFLPTKREVEVKMEVNDDDGSSEEDATPDGQKSDSLAELSREKIEPVLSLAIEQLRKDVDSTCSVLGIAPDPVQWSIDDVKAWLLWTLRQYNLPAMQMDYFNMDGVALASLSEEDFHQRAPQCGSTLYAQLEIWKAACQEIDMAGLLQWSTATNSTCSGSSGDISEDDEVESVPSPTVGKSASTPSAPTGRTGGSHIHLWQFLKELLAAPQLHGSCIRWLDRTKGVFKIEDSVRVARLWGKRKNRPAMNYDKLSRSIRQYYKKGIMKKTERSQRLVYQFCHPYCL